MATTLMAENKSFEPSAWETVSCPFCGSREAKLYEKFGHQLKFSYVRCDTCTLVYQNPRPQYDTEFVTTAYEVYVPDEKNEFYDDNGLLDAGRTMLAYSDALVAEIEKIVPQKGRFLDIGCHIGLLCKAANDRGWRATGVDVSGMMVKAAVNRFDVDARVGDWTQMKFEDKFNAITCNHVLEHIPNPADWLKLMAANLAPGGVIVISLPNVDSADNQFKHKLKELGLKKMSEWEAWRTPDHLFEPNEASFVELAKSVGLKVKAVETYSNKSPRIEGAINSFYHRKLRLGSKLRFFLGT